MAPVSADTSSLWGVIISLGSALLGAGIGWGSMRAGYAQLKEAVRELRGVAQKVSVLEAESPRVRIELDDHGRRIGSLEVAVAKKRR